MSTADVAACLSMDHLLIITDYNAIACDGSNSFELTWSPQCNYFWWIKLVITFLRSLSFWVKLLQLSHNATIYILLMDHIGYTVLFYLFFPLFILARLIVTGGMNCHPLYCSMERHCRINFNCKFCILQFLSFLGK